MTGSFGYGTHNPYISTAFIAKVDQNGRINNIKIFYYPYYLYNTKWTVYSSPYFVWQFVGSGYIVSTRFDYNYQSEASCYNTLLLGTYDLHSFHYNTNSGWLVSSFIYSNYVYWLKTPYMWGSSYYFYVYWSGGTLYHSYSSPQYYNYDYGILIWYFSGKINRPT